VTKTETYKGPFKGTLTPDDLATVLASRDKWMTAGLSTALVGGEGIPVIKGEAGGNTHLLIADGEVRWIPLNGQNLGTVTVEPGAQAFMAHPEHGYMGIAPGSYTIRRQREQADEIRMVAD